VGLRKGKKNKAPTAPSPGIPLPPLPGMPPLPAPPGAPAPAAPLPLPLPPAPAATLPLPPAPTESPSPWPTEGTPAPQTDDSYGDLWAKRSDKPLPQIYGHIDRISSGDAGSLLDRYADRFGHALDRDIIVLRKKSHDDKLSELRDAPVVELLEEEEIDLETQLSAIEDELRSLRPEYQAAKTSGDAQILDQLRPVLQNLMQQRKSLQAMIHGGTETATTAEPVSEEDQEENDLFVTFVGIVDELLGSSLPGEVIEEFMASEEFGVYQEVGADPNNADDEMRAAFFSIVDGQLGNMAKEDIDAFVSSSDFAIYGAVGAQYQ
jgi:hypothetical protein